MSSENQQTTDSFASVTAGQSVYDAEGNELGKVRGVDEDGFYVRSEFGEGMSLDEARDIFGKAYVMWRCWECGEMGQIEGNRLPANCPNCDAAREQLYYWAED
jgi:rubrerythrin